MDTEQYIALKKIEESVRDINYIQGSRDQLKTIIDYVEITRHLQELYQWYLLFKYNLSQIRDEHNYNDLIRANSYAINLISIGKTLLDSIKVFIKTTFSDDPHRGTELIQSLLRDSYDQSFNYRFLYKLRDYAQHGHLIVSLQAGSPTFDLSQIVNTPHFLYKKDFIKDIEDLQAIIQENEKETVCLSMHETFSDYACTVFNILKKLFREVESCLLQKRELFHKEYIDNKEQNHDLISSEYNDYFAYVIAEDSDYIHIIKKDDDPHRLLIYFLNDVIDSYKNELQMKNKIKKNSIFVGKI